jgi:hypothetical protein
MIVCAIMLSFIAWAQEGTLKEPKSSASGYAMKYERMGGYLGVHDELWIYPDGNVISAAGKRAKVRPEAVQTWMKNFLPLAVPHSSAAFPPQSLCMDCLTYRITIYDKGAIRIYARGDIFGSASEAVELNFADMRSQLNNLMWK